MKFDSRKFGAALRKAMVRKANASLSRRARAIVSESSIDPAQLDLSKLTEVVAAALKADPEFWAISTGADLQRVLSKHGVEMNVIVEKIK